MSALPKKADIGRVNSDVRFVQETDIELLTRSSARTAAGGEAIAAVFVVVRFTRLHKTLLRPARLPRVSKQSGF